jgi:hypothetical protein
MKLLTFLPGCLTLAISIAGCKSANVTSTPEAGLPPLPKPRMVYVADFELAAQNVKHEDSVLSGRIGPVGRVGDRLSGNTTDPAVRARQIVELMANSLVKELSKSGFNVTRFRPGSSMPSEGWLLRGVFTEVQEGNRVRRAMIGLGEGQTDIQVVANVQNLSEGPPKPMYEVATEAGSGSMPGAAPTLVLGPYGAAARFVMAGRDLDKNVKETAKQIAVRMAKRVQPTNE